MATVQSSPRSANHHMVFTIPRTASHLLLKLLNLPTQSSLHRHYNNTDGYLFLPAAAPRFRHSLPGKPIQEWTEEQKSALKNAMQRGFDDWLRFIEEAEGQSKSTFIKEHLNWIVDPIAESRLYGYPNHHLSTAAQFQVDWKSVHSSDTKHENNVTCVPDAFLLQHVRPTFLIRHPSLTFPSSLRAAIDNQGISSVLNEEAIHQWECSYYWSLSLYTFYTQAADFDRKSLVDGVEYPIVLDAQDLVDEALVKKYAKAVGLDEDKVRFTWKAAGEEDLSVIGKMEKRMKSTILASSGIETGKLSGVALDVEQLKGEWIEEFGEVLAERLVKLVNNSIDSYERLKRVRLRV